MTETSGSIRLSEERAPLYVVTFDGIVSDQEFQGYLDHTLEITRRGRHAMVFDATHAGLVPPSQRKMQAEWNREHDKLNREMTVALAFVLPNPLLRGLVTAVLWVHPMPCPHRLFGDLESALAWTQGQLEYHGVPKLAAD